MLKHPPPALTVRDVAVFLAVDEKTIYHLAQQGKLPGCNVPGIWRFQIQDIQGWIKTRKVAVQTKQITTSELPS
jgi:excisionase family DNA binding protein